MISQAELENKHTRLHEHYQQAVDQLNILTQKSIDRVMSGLSSTQQVRQEWIAQLGLVRHLYSLLKSFRSDELVVSITESKCIEQIGEDHIVE